jgi:hypothetical protein
MHGEENAADRELTETEVEALHEVELGVENLHRAHGHLVSFHHATGRAMDHLAEAERLLREAGHDEYADALRDEHLPRGVVGGRDGGRWSYAVLEDFQDRFLAGVLAYGDGIHEALAGGQRHVAERRQERSWRARARQG